MASENFLDEYKHHLDKLYQVYAKLIAHFNGLAGRAVYPVEVTERLMDSLETAALDVRSSLDFLEEPTFVIVQTGDTIGIYDNDELVEKGEVTRVTDNGMTVHLNGTEHRPVVLQYDYGAWYYYEPELGGTYTVKILG